MEKKRAKSHEKVEMRKMNNEEDRLISFSKRRSGIYRKASELFTLCGTEVGILAFSPNGEPSHLVIHVSFGHPHINMCNSKSRSYRPCNHVQLYHLIPKQLAMAMEEGHAK
ncbi:hypothetical protein AAG906_030867 [Vitis piasezkii]